MIMKKLKSVYADCVATIKNPPTFGWVRYVNLTLLGCLAALGQAPYYWWPILLISFGIFFHWISKQTYRPKINFADGWFFGFGFFIAGLYWISGALLVPGQNFQWLIPFAVAGIPGLLGVTTGLATLGFAYLTNKFSNLTAIRRIFIFAGLWALCEMLRGLFLFNGFPWNLLGNAFVFSTTLMQVANLVGAYGLSFLVVLIAAGATLWVKSGDKKSGRVALITVLILIAYGWTMIPTASSPIIPGIRLRLVQPNIRQEYKWEEQRKLINLGIMADISKLPARVRPTHIIWPEAALAFQLERSPGLAKAIAGIIRPGGYLITGGPRLERSEDASSGYVNYFNSVLALNHQGDVVAHYDKSHLVPFGEYVPLRAILPMKSVAGGMQDFTPGHGVTTLKIERTPAFSPLICYEIIFPGRVVKNAPRPRWILNVTNDAWYGTSSGPYQHFDMAKLRAVEEGLPVVRVANTGVSGVIDAYGRTVVKLALNQQGAIDADLPAWRLKRTIFSHIGTTGVAILLISIVLSSLGISRLKKFLKK